jgi:LPXTG-motif cell wall-anchored protein
MFLNMRFPHPRLCTQDGYPPMKLSSFGAGLTGAALVAGSLLLGILPASAETIPVTAPDPIPAETAPYSAGWFAGDVAGGDGSTAQTAAGLEIVGGTSGYQLLNGDPAVAGTVGLAAATGLGVSTTGGAAFYQISVFGEPTSAGDKEFTTLYPVDARDLSGNWTNSRAFGVTAAGTQAPLATHVALLDAGEPAQVLAFGLFVNAGETATVRAIGWDGDNYLFATAPTATASPTAVEESNTAAEVTVTGSGFAPNEVVTVATSGVAGDSSEEFTADDAGDVVLVYTADQGAGSLGLGDYVVTFSDASGLFSASTTFSVVADAIVTPGAPPAAAAPAATLANTGVDAMAAVVAAGVLLAAGAGLILVSMRRTTVLRVQ